MFTGAEETKTEEEQKVFGGLANAMLDPCYHKARELKSIRVNLVLCFFALYIYIYIFDEFFVYDETSRSIASKFL